MRHNVVILYVLFSDKSECIQPQYVNSLGRKTTKIRRHFNNDDGFVIIIQLIDYSKA